MSRIRDALMNWRENDFSDRGLQAGAFLLRSHELDLF